MALPVLTKVVREINKVVDGMRAEREVFSREVGNIDAMFSWPLSQEAAGEYVAKIEEARTRILLYANQTYLTLAGSELNDMIINAEFVSRIHDEFDIGYKTALVSLGATKGNDRSDWEQLWRIMKDRAQSEGQYQEDLHALNLRVLQAAANHLLEEAAANVGDWAAGLNEARKEFGDEETNLDREVEFLLSNATIDVLAKNRGAMKRIFADLCSHTKDKLTQVDVPEEAYFWGEILTEVGGELNIDEARKAAKTRILESRPATEVEDLENDVSAAPAFGG